MSVPRETKNTNPLTEKLSGEKKLCVKDFFLTQESFELWEDDKTKLIYTLPQPVDQLSKYYESESYISHTDSNENLTDKIYQKIKMINLKYKLSVLRKASPKAKTVLDYGCGTADFLNLLLKNKYAVLGIEPNEKALAFAQKKIGEYLVSSKNIKDLHSKFDVITLWHVLEHIPNLYETIEEFKNHLKKNGRLIIAVPNHKSYDAQFYKKYWAAYDVPRHLWHFSPESIKLIFNQFGMKVDKQYPMWFDAFYVSLLSEKYMKNEFGFIRAFFIGLISNLKALKSGHFSSIIYEIKIKSDF